jgi:hypothetical protein
MLTVSDQEVLTDGIAAANNSNKLSRALCLLVFASSVTQLDYIERQKVEINAVAYGN